MALKDLPVKRQKYIKERMKGKTKLQAALDSGHSMAQARSVAHSIETPDVRAAFAEVMRRAVNPEKIALRIAEGLDAMETKFFQCEGVVTDSRDVIAYSERRQYSALAAELAGYHIPHKTEIENKQAIIINFVRDSETPLIQVRNKPEV